MPALTKRLIETLEPSDKDYVIWDNKISGFGEKVTPKGRKAYLFKYRSEDGRQRKPSIGVHGNITCEQAREVAANWHAEIIKGNNPAEEKKKAKNSLTISQLCDRFIEEHASIRKKQGGLELDKTVIRLYVKPMLGSLKTATVSKADIQKFHLALKNKPAQANRILRLLSKMFNLAEDWELRPQNSNPVKNVERYKEDARERYLTPQELDSLGKALEESEQGDLESVHFISLVRLLLLTGARLREIMHAKWEWIDWDHGLLKLPDSKTGKKTIHLSPAVLNVLENTPRIDKNPFIIVGAREGQPLISPKKPWMRIKERATLLLLKKDDTYGDLAKQAKTYQELCQLAEQHNLEKPIGMTDVRLHDLRHTFASICVRQGMSLQMVSKLLGHAKASTSERYAHLAHDPISNAAAQVGEGISQALGQK